MDVVDEMRWLLDSALDRAVVPGFSNEGYRPRQAGGKDDPAPEPHSGRTPLVTGANHGIARVLAASLARLSAGVLPPRHR
jgi:hypothetical protein